MKRPYQITSVIWLLFAIFLMFQAREHDYWTPFGPGPGFFPFWLAILFVPLSIAMFYQATFGSSDPMPEDFLPSKVGMLKGLAVIVALVWVILTMQLIGFRLSMLVFLLFLLFILGRANPLPKVLVALLGSFGAYWLFHNQLHVPLPSGLLDQYLPFI